MQGGDGRCQHIPRKHRHTKQSQVQTQQGTRAKAQRQFTVDCRGAEFVSPALILWPIESPQRTEMNKNYTHSPMRS